MKRFVLFVFYAFNILLLRGEDYIESYGLLSDDYINSVSDIQLIRQINGGTVILTSFDDSCPEEMKGPFNYACKIVEEYIPPCLPLTIKVSCGRVNGSSKEPMSKVLSRSKENFGDNLYYKNSPMSMIKGVILSELSHGSSVTYLDYIPDVEFLNTYPDIEITYNEQKLGELSFSIESDPGDKYDFVSLAIRDIFIGLGLSSSFRYNPSSNELLNPAQEMTPFENLIDKSLGKSDSSTRLIKATSGSVILSYDISKSLKLYAPHEWEKGVSLNSFIPQEDCDISNILSYNFGKGTVYRSLNDDYKDFVFRELLGWKANYVVGNDQATCSNYGSTAIKMPYNGSMEFNWGTQANVVSNTESINKLESQSVRDYQDNDSLCSYINQFHPSFPYIGNIKQEGICVSILKKDGCWDCVASRGYEECPTFSMSDLDLHYGEEEYARTADGYLRAKITFAKRNNGYLEIDNRYFVIDYLPQKIKLKYRYSVGSTYESDVCSVNADGTETPVRVYFSDLEGINRVVLERLKLGLSVPSKIEISDFKKGYYDTTIDQTTTFTAVGYNDNGYSRGIPITINPSLQLQDSGKVLITSDAIFFASGVGVKYSYSIYSASPKNSQLILSGTTTTGRIDISTLSPGVYILNLKNMVTNVMSDSKFIKKL
ncbi:MAG: hypothetical protein NC095_00885 [Muribaculum sp.]|nr:hypothetical protein [Muribaculum sp.]